MGIGQKPRPPAAYHIRESFDTSTVVAPSFGVWRAPRQACWWWESTNRKRPGLQPGAFLFAPTERRWCPMRQIRFNVAITIDHRFVLAVSLGLVSVLGIVLLLLRK